jgi:hypothetical protein
MKENKNFRDKLSEVFTIKLFNYPTKKLTPSPLRTVFAVFDGHAHRFELVTDFI